MGNVSERRVIRQICGLVLLGSLAASVLAAQPDTTPPVIEILESGTPLTTGAQFSRTVSPVIQATDASAVTVDALLDGLAFTSGSPVGGEGEHVLSVTALDAAGNRASRQLTFTVDLTPPVFASLAPATGSVIAAGSITLAGHVHGAVELRIDGTAIPLVEGAFTAGPYGLAEGARTFTLSARDAAGNVSTRSHAVERDSLMPVLTASAPSEGQLVGSARVDVVGVVTDATATEVTVNGTPASRQGTSFLAAQVPLAEGPNVLTVRAVDAAGNATRVYRRLELDTRAPSLTIDDPAPGSEVPDGSIVVRGRVSDAHLEQVTVNGVAAAVAGGAWSASVPLVLGGNVLAVTARDVLAHTTEASVEIWRANEALPVRITSPEEGAVLGFETVPVEGTVGSGTGVTVSVNGTAANVSGSAFTLSAVALVEGENRLTARAADAAGNRGSHARLVRRDTVAPRWLASSPPSGAAGVPALTRFELQFDEELASPTPGAWRLETASGSLLDASVAVLGDQLVLVPNDPLPSASEVRLVLGSALTDLAGNALANPQTLTFTVGDEGAPAAPVLATIPAALCATSLALSGSAEADARIDVAGGASFGTTRAAADGAFALAVALTPEATQRLRVTATDRSGNVSPAVWVDVRHDCTAPRVEGLSRLGNTVTVTFSEPLEPASTALPGAVTVSDASGSLGGSVSLAASGREMTWTALTSLPAGAVRVQVSTQVRDLAGNELEVPYSQLTGEVSTASFVTGTVIDHASGRPLAGAHVVIIAVNGVLTAEPRPERTTGPNGRFQLASTAGTVDLTIWRDGFTPVFRVVALESGQGLHVLAPRLSPAGEVASVGSSGGGVQSSGLGGESSALDVPPGAWVEPTPIRLTVLDEQALPARLPYGWSPRGAVWLELGSAPAEALTLELPADAPDGLTLPVVSLDLATLQWRVVALAPVVDGHVSVPVSTGGGFAVVEPDGGATAPSPAVVGSVLAATPAFALGSVLAAEISFDPDRVLPTQVSRAGVAYQLAGEIASGQPLTVVVSEELRLLDGSIRRETPYQADLILYRSSQGTPRSRFWLRPSTAATLLPLDLGTEDVVLRLYAGDAVAGNVVGVGGGTISDPEGDRIDIAPGALSTAHAVTLSRRLATDLPAALPPGFELAGVVEVDLGGAVLLQPAALSLALSPAPAVEARGLLFELVELAGTWRYRPVAELEATAGGWSTRAIDPTDLPWPGVRRGGLYAFAVTEMTLAYLRGTVIDVDASALTSAVVSAAAVSGWLQLSAGDGSYVLPVPLGAGSATAVDPVRLNQIERAYSATIAEERVDLDLALRVVAPRVVQTNPAEGAQNVLLGVQPTVRFSEAVDAATLDGRLQLRLDGVPVPLNLHASGDLVTLEPRASLLPGSTYELRVALGIRDLQGYGLTSPLTTHFTTRESTLAAGIEPSRIVLIAPDAAGLARVVGRPGALPAGALVFVENITALAGTTTTTVLPDGSFELPIAASLTDRLLLHVLIEGGNEVVLPLGPFLRADQRGGHIGPQGGSFITVDGVRVSIEPGTFDRATVVSLVPLPASPLLVPAPSFLQPLSRWQLDFGGALAASRIRVDFPAPPGATPKDYMAFMPIPGPDGRSYWRLQEHLRLEDGALTTAPPPAGTSQPLVRILDMSETGLSQSSDPAKTGPATCNRYDCVRGLAWPGQLQLMEPFAPMAFRAIRLGDFGAFLAVEERLAVTMESRIASQVQSFDVGCIPMRLDRPTRIEKWNLLTAVREFSGLFDPPASGGEVTVLPPDAFGDEQPPYPVSASPFAIHRLDLIDGETTNVARGISAERSNGSLTVTGAVGAVGPGVAVRLLAFARSLAHQPAAAQIGAASAQAGTDGSFSLSIAAPALAPVSYLLAVSARVEPGDAFEIRFSEGISPDLAGIEVRAGNGALVSPRIERAARGEVVRITPRPAWQAGVSYELVLASELADTADNAWGAELRLPFEVSSSQQTGDFPAFTEVDDIERFGSWLFVAAAADGLAVLDIGDPTHLTNLIPGHTFQLPFADPVRGVAVDPHGRVVLVGGGQTFHGQLAILDPLRLDPAALAAGWDDPEVRNAAFRGRTRISDQLDSNVAGSQLREGLPRRVSVVSSDERSVWRFGSTPPAGITVTPATVSAEDAHRVLQVEISGVGVAGHPVSLRNPSRGQFARVDADNGGAFTLTVSARQGEELELLRNQSAVAYVAIAGSGFVTVDLDAVYAPDNNANASAITGVYDREPGFSLCGQFAGDGDFGPLSVDVAALSDNTNEVPLAVFGLLSQRGFLVAQDDLNQTGHLDRIAQVCSDVEASTTVTGLEAVPGYRFDFDGDGELEPSEERDYLLVTHAAAGVLVYDVERRHQPTLVGRLRLDGQAHNLSVDRGRRRLLVGGGSAGLFVLDFDRVPSLDLLDANADGIDDRVIDHLVLTGTTNAAPLIVPGQAIAYVGGEERPVTGVSYAPPEILAYEQRNPNEAPRRVEIVGPLGVPLADGEPLPASLRLVAFLPGSFGPEILLDVEALGPTGARLADLGALTGLPRTRLEGEHGLIFRRMSDHPWDDGYGMYESEEIVLLADPRASHEYSRNALENEQCERCDAREEGVGAEARELLAGDSVIFRFGGTVADALADIYGEDRLAAAELEIESTRWEMVPSLRQEPALHPAASLGDAVPGTLLASGELTQDATDLAIPGRGLDFAFTRTYRAQTVGAGPLGPGWDHVFNQRLRLLPNGNVEHYDGTGRRETYGLEQGDGGEPRYVAPAGRFTELHRSAAGWRLVDADHTQRIFDLAGRLISVLAGSTISEQCRSELRLEYDDASRLARIVDTMNRRYQLAYDGNGRLISLTDFDGRTVRYAYDAQGRLETVTQESVALARWLPAADLETRYAYDGGGDDLAQQLHHRDNLTALTDPRGVAVLGVTYGDPDGDGRRNEVTAEQWGEGTVNLSYAVGSGSTEVTDRRGHTMRYRTNAAGQLLEASDPARPAHRLAMSYDPEGRRTGLTLAEGIEIGFGYGTSESNRRGQGLPREITVTPAAGSLQTPLTTTLSYDPRTNQPDEVVDARGVRTKIERDERGLPTDVYEAYETAEQRHTSFEYDACGQRTRRIDPELRVTTTLYELLGDDSSGYPTGEVVDVGGLELVTLLGLDSRGHVVSVTDPRGARTNRIVNPLGWPLAEERAVTDTSDGAGALSIVHETAYDGAGGRIAERIPAGEAGASFTLVETIRGTLGEVREVRRHFGDLPASPYTSEVIAYDANLNAVERTGPDGQRTVWVRDAYGRVLSESRGFGTPEAVTRHFAYDDDGRPTNTIDGRGSVWVQQYDGLGRPWKSFDPLGNFREFSYDAVGNATHEFFYQGGATSTLLAQTEAAYDLLNQRVAVAEVLLPGTAGGQEARLTTSFTYSPVGRLLQQTDPRGNTTTYVYDTAHRLVKTNDAAGNETLLTLDKNGNITQQLSREQGSAGIVEITETATYDAVNRLVSQRDALGNERQWHFDVRDQVVRTVDPAGNVSSYEYDALGRRTKEIMPEGIVVEHVFDSSSRPTLLRDSLGNETTWTYNGIDRAASVSYADGTSWSYSYDAAGDLASVTDARGLAIAQSYDPAGRLVGRSTPTPVPGIPALIESYTYDGLSRLSSATSQGIAVDLEYDSLSRVTSETVAGKTVHHEYDAAGNPTKLTYPSGLALNRDFDALNRPQSLTWGANSSTSFTYRGPYLRIGATLANGLEQTRTFDGARRLLSETVAGTGVGEILERSWTWNARNLRTSEIRGEANDRADLYAYDDASRLTTRAKLGAAPSLTNNTDVPVALLQDITGGERFSLDGAQNLLARTSIEEAIPEPVALPLDASGRNRPASANGQPVEWDANGNLVRVGTRRYEWDARNRLIKVKTLEGDELASFDYDAANRLVRRMTPNGTEQTAWSGWQELETWKDGQIQDRLLYGPGLDEVIAWQKNIDGDGDLEQQSIPLYDPSGSVVALTDGAGRPIERYSYTSHGEREVLVDSTPPTVEQVRVVGNELWLELSEEIQRDKVTTGTLVLTWAGQTPPANPPAPMWPVTEGPNAGRRIVLPVSTPPAAGTSVSLTLEAEGMVDLFALKPAADYQLSFNWPAGDALVYDGVAPSLSRALLREGHLELHFTEQMNLATTAAILWTGAALTWQPTADAYGLRSLEAVPAGSYTLTVGAGVQDLAGTGLASEQTINVEAASGTASAWLFRAADLNVLTTSAAGFTRGFQGRPVDDVAGLVYFRNRWYSPELGRFVSADPLGYVDGPNDTAFALNDPVNKSDPMGLKGRWRDPLSNEVIEIDGYDLYALLKQRGQSPAEAVNHVRAAGLGAEYEARKLTEIAEDSQQAGEMIKIGLASSVAAASGGYFAGAGLTYFYAGAPGWLVAGVSGAGGNISALGASDLVRWQRSSLESYAWAGGSGFVLGTAFHGAAQGARRMGWVGPDDFVSILPEPTPWRAVPRGLIAEFEPSGTTVFSGAYDQRLGQLALRPSGETRLPDGQVPSNIVDRFGGHGDVAEELVLGGSQIEDTVGFTVFYSQPGRVEVGWNSGTLNLRWGQGRAVPERFREGILRAIAAETGLPAFSR